MHQISDEQLIAFAAREMQGADAETVGQHIGTCQECAARLRRFALVRETLRGDDSTAPPEATLARAQALLTPVPRHAQTGSRWTFLPVNRRAAAIMAAALLLISLCGLTGTAQVAAAADGALPGDTLYPIKTSTEGIRLALSADPVDQVQMRLNFAQARVAEAQKLSSQKRYDHIQTAITGYQMQVAEATKTLGILAVQDHQRAVLTAVQAIDVFSNAQAVLNKLSVEVPVAQQQMVTSALNDSTASVDTLKAQIGYPAGTSAKETPTLEATKAATSVVTSAGTAPRGEPPTSTPMPAPVQEIRTPPGQVLTPPGQVLTPPGQANTPPGQVLTPPRQANTPPGQVLTPPGQANTPPGQNNNPPSHDNNPPGQDKNPPGQEKEPPGQDKEPPGKGK